MNSNQVNYQMNTGNVAVVKGMLSGNTTLNGQSVMCLVQN